MQVLVLGINHQIQSRRIIGASTGGQVEEFECGQKERYGELLSQIIKERCIDLVGEEADHREEMIAAEICRRLDCDYVNVEMPPEERAARNIPAGYREKGSRSSEEEKARLDNEREEDMCARLTAAWEGRTSSLIICGRVHVPGLAQRLIAAGHTVETADLRDSDWYIEDWVHHIIYNL